MTKKIIRNFGG